MRSRKRHDDHRAATEVQRNSGQPHEKISRAFTGGHPTGGLTRDRILDNITLYWLTNTATPAARMYWEGVRSTAAAAGQPPPPVSLPVAFTVSPARSSRAPRSWAEKVYPNLIYFHEADRDDLTRTQELLRGCPPGR
jgi:hypothetical protein